MVSKELNHSNKKSAKIVGALFLTAMAASLVGGFGFIEPVLSALDPLMAASEHETQIVIGVLLELINAISVLGIAVFMFPILKQFNEKFALGYLSFRIIEVVWCSMIVVSPLALISLGQASLQTGAADAPGFAAASVSLLAIRAAVANLLIPVFFSLGALLLYSAMYQSRRLPRFISVWGLIAVALVIVLNLLSTFNIEVSLNISMLFALPIITNEIFLGIWLLVKGFNAPAELQ